MSEKKDDGSLKRLRAYIAEEAERLGQCGGRVLHIDLDDIDADGSDCVPTPSIDPLERDVGFLFGPMSKRRGSDAKKPLA